MSVPSISIIIPAFNSARFIGSTLRSVQEQSLTDWECVVVDDGSTDDTLEVARSFGAADKRIRAVRIANSGESGARNHGYRLTNPEAEFVTFMDSDDVWLPDALARLHSWLRSDPAAVGAHALAEMIDESGASTPNWSHADHGRSRVGLEGKRLVPWPLERPTTFDVLINGNVLNPPGLLLARRSVLEQVGRFDEQINGGADWDMLIRLSRHGHIAFVNEVILRYRRHGSNLGARAGIERQAWLIRCKGFHSPENTPEQQRIARLGWRAYQRDMMRTRLRAGAVGFRSGNLRQGFDSFARLPVHAFRLVRGCPTPRLVRGSEPWGPRLKPD